MRTVGEVIMIAAALVAVVFAAGYSWPDRPDGRMREFLRSGEWPVPRPPFGLKFFGDHSAWTVFLPLFLVVLGVGWVLRHYG